MTAPQRYGMTIPFDGVPLAEHRDWFRELVDLGYTDVWSSEANAADGFTPLALAAAWAPELRLGSAIVPAYTRAPACLAQSVASLADAAPGRVAFGIGTSSEAIVSRWNGIPFEEPYRQVRDMVRFLRESLAGEKVTGTYGRSDVKGFKLGLRPAEQPAILVAALREGMLRLAGREGDGVIINWLSADDVRTVVPVTAAAAEAAGRGAPEVVARIFVVPTADREHALSVGRFVIPMYLAAAPVYAEFHRWLGRGEELAEMWRRWDEGDRAGAGAAIPESVVDDLIVSGSPEECREHVGRYVEAGVTTPALAILLPGGDQRQAVRDLAPRP